MQLFKGPSGCANVDAAAVSDLAFARARRLSFRDAMPFGTRRHTVPPGESGRAERHHNLELSRVVAGAGLVEVAGSISDVVAGDAVLFESGETHVFHNRSTTQPLVIFTICWVPRAAAASGVGPEAITA